MAPASLVCQAHLHCRSLVAVVLPVVFLGFCPVFCPISSSHFVPILLRTHHANSRQCQPSRVSDICHVFPW
eukprot:2222644-Pleurochrysis_carterae.AAC.1